MTVCGASLVEQSGTSDQSNDKGRGRADRQGDAELHGAVTQLSKRSSTDRHTRAHSAHCAHTAHTAHHNPQPRGILQVRKGRDSSVCGHTHHPPLARSPHAAQHAGCTWRGEPRVREHDAGPAELLGRGGTAAELAPHQYWSRRVHRFGMLRSELGGGGLCRRGRPRARQPPTGVKQAAGQLSTSAHAARHATHAYAGRTRPIRPPILRTHDQPRLSIVRGHRTHQDSFREARTEQGGVLAGASALCAAWQEDAARKSLGGEPPCELRRRKGPRAPITTRRSLTCACTVRCSRLCV